VSVIAWTILVFALTSSARLVGGRLVVHNAMVYRDRWSLRHRLCRLVISAVTLRVLLRLPKVLRLALTDENTAAVVRWFMVRIGARSHWLYDQCRAEFFQSIVRHRTREDGRLVRIHALKPRNNPATNKGGHWAVVFHAPGETRVYYLGFTPAGALGFCRPIPRPEQDPDNGQDAQQEKKGRQELVVPDVPGLLVAGAWFLLMCWWMAR
jgi:hypothetical protein